MRKLFLLFFCLPVCLPLTVGCGGSDEPTVVTPSPEANEAAEAEQAEADAETTE